jgi:glycosyltransferase involved in cell wall biosynthesis
MEDTPDPNYVPKNVFFERTSYIDEWMHALGPNGIDPVKYVPYRQIKKVEAGFHRLGHSVKLIPVESRMFPVHLLNARRRTHYGETSLFYRLESFIFTFNLLKQAALDGIDVLHYVNYFSSNFVFSPIMSRKFPIIVMYTGGDLPTNAVLRWIWYFGLHPALSAAKLILIGDYPERLLSLSWMMRGNLSRIRTFDILRVDTEVFRPGDRAEARARLNVAPEMFEILCVLSVIPLPHADQNMKDPYALLRVFKTTIDESAKDNLLLTVVGSGPGLEHMKKAAESLGVEKYTRFVGPVGHSALPQYYAASDLVFVPFKLESLKHTHVLIESFACARPAVAFAKNSSIHEDWEGGFLISAEPMEGGRALARIISDRGLLNEKTADASRLATYHDLRSGMTSLVKFYREVSANS